MIEKIKNGIEVAENHMNWTFLFIYSFYYGHTCMLSHKNYKKNLETEAWRMSLISFSGYKAKLLCLVICLLSFLSAVWTGR